MKLKTKILLSILVATAFFFLAVVAVFLLYEIIFHRYLPVYDVLILCIAWLAITLLVALYLIFLIRKMIKKDIDYITDLLKGQFEHQVEVKTNELHMLNQKLRNELSERQLVERELLIHKERLIKLAHYDNLTNLPNKVFFNEVLNKAIKLAKRHNKVLAVLFLDIDHFKKINTTFGHHVGDWVVKQLSSRFNSVLRASDTIARVSGDEFMILLNDIDSPKLAAPVAEKLLQCCSEPLNFESHLLKLTASIGVAIFPDDGESLEDLQKHADSAMFKAKQTGGNVYQYYRQEMFEAAHEHVRLESALRRAIQNNEFELYYQPQLSLENGSIRSVEALIRWKHPELGLLNPSKFIPFAEETGLILSIGEWALREACQTSMAWQREGYEPITVAVNISPKQFRQQDVARLIKNILQETKLRSDLLEIEITETVIMENVDITTELLTSLHTMGVRIAIDDFGTGYTSLSYLKQFPVSVLKIDRSFIKGVPNNQNDAAITTAVISLGHSLGLDVVAEGVETIEQIQYLAEHNCDLIQGYFLSRPLPANKIILQFSKGKSQPAKV